MTKKKEGFLEEEDVPAEEGAEEGFDEEEEPLSADPAVPEKADEDDFIVPDTVSEEAVRMTGDVPVQVVAVLGKKTISVKELVGLKMGHVVDLSRPANEMVDLVAGGKLVAKGELVDIDGKLGVRIVKMVR